MIEGFIISQLDAAGIDWEIKGRDIAVSCIFHEHSGTKKKLCFLRESDLGVMHCWVCRKSGIWNTYAAEMNATRGTAFDLIDVKKAIDIPAAEDLARILNRPVRNDSGIEIPHLIPIKTGWRGLDIEFLRDLPSFLWFDSRIEEHRILWPVTHGNRVRGYTAAILDGSWASPKAWNLPGFKANLFLFPLHHPLVIDAPYVVLVEGQFDALRLLHLEIPALCIFGCGNWSEEKRTIIEMLGKTRIILAMDGDRQGWDMASQIWTEFNGIAEVRALHLGAPQRPTFDTRGQLIEFYDPGNCPAEFAWMIHQIGTTGETVPLERADSLARYQSGLATDGKRYGRIDMSSWF